MSEARESKPSVSTSKKVLGAGVLGLALAAPVWAAPPTSAPPAAASADIDAQTEQAIERAYDLSRAFQRVAKNVTPAVVNVTARKGGGPQGDANEGQPQQMDDLFRQFFGPQFRSGPRMPVPPRESFGSGVIVSADGYILTNNHVIEGAELVTVSTGDNAKFTAKVVGTDPATDIAVLKIEGETFPFAPLGDSEQLNVGEWVIAIGNPFSLSHTVTAGIVSAKGRVQRDLGEVQFQDFIQTDAAINPGNSGGPLLNLRGQVVGINSAILSRAGGNIGIGFAIPANLAQSVMTQLIDGGKVQRGFVGVVPQDLDDDLARSFGYSGTSGALIAEVSAGSPAEAAGLKQGDIVVRVGSRTTNNANSLRNAIAQIAPGKTAPFEVFRDGKKLTLDVKVANREESIAAAGENAEVSNSTLGVSVAELTDQVRERLRDRRAPSGVLVTKVTPGSLTAQLGLRVDDIILEVNRSRVENVEQFVNAASNLNTREGVRLTVRSRGVNQYLFIRGR